MSISALAALAPTPASMPFLGQQLGTITSNSTTTVCKVLLDGATDEVTAVLNDHMGRWLSHNAAGAAAGTRVLGTIVGRRFYVLQALSGPLAQDLHVYGLQTNGHVGIIGTIYSFGQYSGGNGLWLQNGFGGATVFQITQAGIGTGAGMDSVEVLKTGSQVINTTTSTDVTDLTTNVTSPGTTAVWIAHVALDVEHTTAGTFIGELWVDGAAVSGQIIVQIGNGNRIVTGRPWRITGLAAGSKNIKVRAKMLGGSTSATVAATHSTLVVERKA